MKSRETCVFAKPSQVFKGTWYTGPQKYTWFGDDMPEGFQFTYKADQVQMTFLQLLSDRVRQNVTYHCRNSVAYYDQANGNYDKAIKFLTANDLELTAGHRKFTYSVPVDDCMYRQNKWDKTVFEFKTSRTRRLPVVDIAPFDIGDTNQGFGLEIGPVCYS